MRKLRNAFVTGLLVLVPLLATVDILRWFFRMIDTATRNYVPTSVLPFDFWGMGVVISLILVLATGVLTQNYVGTLVIVRFDRLIRRFPLVGGIYGAIKKFLETIFNPSSNQFKKTVLVEFPTPGMYSVGFVTGEPDPKLQQHSRDRLLNIFIPLVPNPISGFYIVIPEEKVTPLDLTVQEAFKIVVSMGIVRSDEAVNPLAKRAAKPKRKK